MKINNFGRVNLNPYQKQVEKQEQAAAIKKKDKVEISSEALELQKGSPLEVERQQLIKDLKEKVQSGKYEADPQKIAERMYDFWNNK